GLVTSIADLAPWFGFLTTGRTLGVELRDALLERAVLADGTELPYAYGLYHWTLGETRAFGHGGGLPGYRSSGLVLADRGLGVGVVSNQSAVDVVELSNRIARGLIGAAEPPGRVYAPGEVFSGDFHDPEFDDVITVEPVDEGRITAGGLEYGWVPAE